MNRRQAIGVAAASLGAAAVPALASEPSQSIQAVPRLAVRRDSPIVVAFVIGEMANVMDMSGSWEVFQDSTADGWNTGSFTLYTIADGRAPLKATGGLALVPTYAFNDTNVPQPNVIVMGAQGQHTKEKIAWIREASMHADVVMSVCTGAFLLAQTGLIDGLSATTHHDFYDSFSKKFPSIKLVRDVRYVENPGGKFCSAGGITSGMELAFRVVERYFGQKTPAQTAYYMEYRRSSTPPTQASA